MDSSIETQNYDPIDNIEISKDDSSQDLEVNDALAPEKYEELKIEVEVAFAQLLKSTTEVRLTVGNGKRRRMGHK